MELIKEIEIAEKELLEARKKVNSLKEKQIKESEPSLKRHIGKCYKYMNCYSVPQSEDDYWPLYSIVLDIVLDVDGEWLIVNSFQKTNDGRIEIRLKHLNKLNTLGKEVDKTELSEAYKELMSTIPELAF